MKNEIPKISVIIPVYNSEKYLHNCLESVAKQSYDNFEIVLIDDGSTDSSGTICNEWAKKDTRIHVIHQKNGGVTVARKVGVDHSTGEWVCFVDSDDSLPDDSLKILSLQIRDDVDMIYGAVKVIGNMSFSYKYFGEKDTTQYLKLLLHYQLYWAPFGRLIRRSAFNAFIFEIPRNITIGEDFIMNLRLAQNVRRVILLPDIVYYYILRPGSAMSNLMKLDKKYMRNFIKIFNESISDEYRKEVKGAIICFHIKRYWRMTKRKIKKILSIFLSRYRTQ